MYNALNVVEKQTFETKLLLHYRRKKHERVPLMEALEEYVQRDVVPFDVPGHKRGRGNPYLQTFFGEQVMKLDINSLPELDQLSHPTGVIEEAQQLLADAYGAHRAYFMVNGTTSAVHSMILSTCGPGDKILLPRNVHKSAINALIFSDAIPIYMECDVHEELGVATTVTFQTAKKVIDSNLDAKAIFLINPSYWGFCTDLREIVEYAHSKEMIVLVDEAHGAHFAFHEELPPSAISVGADLVGTSLHKTGGSLTQSSVLLVNEGRVDVGNLSMMVNMLQSTSASYLLMCSLDGARKNLVLHGEEYFSTLLPAIRRAKKALNMIPGIYAYGKELVGQKGIQYVDETKLGINVAGLGITGFEVYELLRTKYQIQLELGDVYNVLAIASLGDCERTLMSLVDAMWDISNDVFGKSKEVSMEYIPTVLPEVMMSPRKAFYAAKESVVLSEAIGRISGESVMAYPPGIPIVTPGELITVETIEYIEFLKKQNANLTDAKDVLVETLTVIKQGVW